MRSDRPPFRIGRLVCTNAIRGASTPNSTISEFPSQRRVATSATPCKQRVEPGNLAVEPNAQDRYGVENPTFQSFHCTLYKQSLHCNHNQSLCVSDSSINFLRLLRSARAVEAYPDGKKMWPMRMVQCSGAFFRSRICSVSNSAVSEKRDGYQKTHTG